MTQCEYCKCEVMADEVFKFWFDLAFCSGECFKSFNEVMETISVTV